MIIAYGGYEGEIKFLVIIMGPIRMWSIRSLLILHSLPLLVPNPHTSFLSLPVANSCMRTLRGHMGMLVLAWEGWDAEVVIVMPLL